MASCFFQSFFLLLDKQSQSETHMSMIPSVNLKMKYRMTTRSKNSKDMSPNRILSLTDLVESMRWHRCDRCNNRTRCNNRAICNRCNNRTIQSRICIRCNSRGGMIYRLVSQLSNKLLHNSQSPNNLMLNRLAKMTYSERHTGTETFFI